MDSFEDSNIPSQPPRVQNAGSQPTAADLPAEDIHIREWKHLYADAIPSLHPHGSPPDTPSFGPPEVQLGQSGDPSGPAVPSSAQPAEAALLGTPSSLVMVPEVAPAQRKPRRGLTVWDAKALLVPGVSTLELGLGEGSSSNDPDWEKEFLAKCKHGKKTKPKKHWEKHCRYNPHRDERLTCDICGMAITNRDDLMKRHKADKHQVSTLR